MIQLFWWRHRHALPHPFCMLVLTCLIKQARVLHLVWTNHSAFTWLCAHAHMWHTQHLSRDQFTVFIGSNNIAWLVKQHVIKQHMHVAWLSRLKPLHHVTTSLLICRTMIVCCVTQYNWHLFSSCQICQWNTNVTHTNYLQITFQVFSLC